MLVRQIMKDKEGQAVIVREARDEVSSAAATLAKHRIGAVIVSADGASVAGILSERDIVRELGKRGRSACRDKVAS